MTVLETIKQEMQDEITKRYTDIRDENMKQWVQGKASGLRRGIEIVDKHIKERQDESKISS